MLRLVRVMVTGTTSGLNFYEIVILTFLFLIDLSLLQVIYICRSPKASVPSLYKVLNYLKLPSAPSLREYFEQFLNGENGGE